MFKGDGVFSVHNNYVLIAVNPHGARSSGRQQRFPMNVWTGMIQDHLIGSYLLPDWIDIQKYLVFLQEMSLDSPLYIPAKWQDIIWLKHDGEPAHFSNNLRNYLNSVFPNRMIRRRGSSLLASQISLFLLFYLFFFALLTSKTCRVIGAHRQLWYIAHLNDSLGCNFHKSRPISTKFLYVTTLCRFASVYYKYSSKLAYYISRKMFNVWIRYD